MRSTTALPVALALLVVLSGCGSLGGTNRTETAPSTGFAVATGGDLDFDPTTVYRHVLEVQGKTLAGQTQLTVRVEHDPGETGIEYRPTRFERVWGIGVDAPNATLARHDAYVGGGGTLNTALVNATGDRKRWVAHELASTTLPGFHPLGNQIPRTYEGEQLESGLREGAAAYVATRYAKAHLDATDERPAWRTLRANLTTAGALAVAPIYFGERYVAQRVDSPADVELVLDSPAWTTEQLLHGLSPDEAEPRSLSVATDAGDGWQRNDTWGRYLPTERAERMGELFVRVLLERHLDADRAATAAAGWGNDRVLRFERRGSAGYAWVVRWDGESDAAEFEAAMTDYLSRAGTEGDVGWRANGTTFDVTRASADTVVVFAGSDRFVSGASAEANGGEVTVSVGREE